MDLDPLEDPHLELDPDPELDSDPAWIRIHMIPIPALLDTIPDSDSDPAKNGIVTPLIWSHNWLDKYFDCSTTLPYWYANTA